MKRLPIRLRVAVAFALAMAVVLAGTGAFLYARLGADLSGALDQGLRLRAQDLSALVRQRDGSLAAAASGVLVEHGESFAQLVGPRGRVLETTPSLGTRPLLRRDELRSALQRPLFVDRPGVHGLDEPARLLATSVERGQRRLLLVVGASRENRAEALSNLRTELLIVGPVALVLATGLGYLLAGAGLRTVEAMRRRAAEISADRLAERLPIPPSGDELARLGETLNEMLARLEEAVARERAFVADASHELRTPLALLRAELDLALRYAQSEAELRDALREASEETDRLIQLAADLLLIAASDHGRMPLRPEPLAAPELLESVRNRFAWRAAETGRPLHVDAPDGLVVSGDRHRLEQALGNLVDNALRHAGGEIRIEARRLDGRLELHVCDEGDGFPPDFLPHAFRRFSRAEERRTTSGGAGLGLAIVDAIARAHGGAAHAQNLSGRGADVSISLSDPGDEPAFNPTRSQGSSRPG